MNKNSIDTLRFIHILFFTALCFVHVNDIQARDPAHIDPKEIEAFADEFFNVHMESMHIPGAVFVVVEGDRCVFNKGYGYANIEKKSPVTPEQTLFWMGSVSKLFTATAVMQLYEKGLIDLHKDVNTYLERFKIPATYPEPVTMSHLLTHSAGFDWRIIGTSSRSGVKQPTLRDHLAARMPPRIRPVGTVSSYSNYGIALAGYIVEKLSGVPFEQYVQEHILQPLEMHHSSFLPHPDTGGDYAIGYWYQPPDVYGPIQPEYLNIRPVGQLTATAADMANFIIAHLQQGRFKNMRILEQATAQLMHQRQFAHHPQLPGWCYGFNENFRNGYRTIGHAGGISGIWSYVLLVPNEQTGFFVSQNGGGEFLASVLIKAFMDKFFPGSPRTIDAPAKEFPSTDLSTLTGQYRYTVHPHTTIGKLQILLGVPEVEVRMNEGGLLTVHNRHSGHIKVPPGPYRQIAPLLFQEVDGIKRIAFRRDEQGRVTHLFSDTHWDAVSYDKLSWYDSSVLHFRLLAFCSLVFLSACITWPVGALIRRVRKKQAASTRQFRMVSCQAHLARLCGGLTCSLELAMLIALSLHLYISPPALGYGELGMIPFLLVLPLITTALTICLVVFLVLSWKTRYWSLLSRLHYTLVVAAATALIPFLWYWNLLGFNY